MTPSEEKMGFFSHLAELRKRLINCLIFLFIFFIICYFFSEYIYGFLVSPYAEAVKNDDVDRRLIFTALQETFLTYLKVSFFTAFFITSPFILIQIWNKELPERTHSDNTVGISAIQAGMSKKLSYMRRTQRVSSGFLSDYIYGEDSAVLQEATAEQPADVFTKSLAVVLFWKCLKFFGIG